MSGRGSTSIIVVRYGEEMVSGLSRCVLKHRWTVVDGRVGSPMRQVLQAGARAVVVQVSASQDSAVALIEKIRRHWNPVVVVAIADDASERGELVVRRAGATAYLGPSAGVEALESVLRQTVPGAIPEPLETVEVKVRKGEPGTKKSKGNRHHGGAG